MQKNQPQYNQRGIIVTPYFHTVDGWTQIPPEGKNRELHFIETILEPNPINPVNIKNDPYNVDEPRK